MSPKFLSRHPFCLWFCGLALLGTAHTVYAPPPTPRYALVIGNARHNDQRLGTLRTARNDAEDIAKGLANVGYQVTSHYDSELADLKQAVSAFSEKAQADSSALAVVYFAGHGLQKNGRDFLLPTNFDTRQEPSELDKVALAVDLDLIKRLSGREGANVIILDACREDPFGERDGLAQVDNVPNGTLVEFSAEPNNPAMESVDAKAPERNGVFAKQLLKKLDAPSPEIDIRHFFDMVGNNVYEVTHQVQKPRVMTAQTPPPMPAKLSLAPENAPNPVSNEERKSWQRVAKSTSACAFQYHLKQFPNSAFADSCRATINAIQSKLESATKAFADLPPDLKAQVTKTFKEKQEASAAECAQKWSDAKQNPLALRQKAWGNAIELAPSPHGGRLGWGRPIGGETFDLDRPHPNLPPMGEGTIEFNSTALRMRGLQPASYHPSDRRYGSGLQNHHPHAQPAPSAKATLLALAEGSDFSPAEGASKQMPGDEEFQADLLSAEQGEINAMYRIALIYEEGSHDVEQNEVDTLHWLALSSSLGNGLASYKLYRYFAGQSTGYAKAVKYKSLASRQGFYGPVTLSEKR